MHVRDLFAVLKQDIIKLPHQVTVDGFSRTDMLEFQEHVEGSRRRAQCLKRPINDGDRFIFDRLSRHMIVIGYTDLKKEFTVWAASMLLTHLNCSVEVVHDHLPTAQVTDVERIKISSLDRQRQLSHSAENFINLFVVTSD